MKFALDNFVTASINAELGSDRVEGVESALRHYARKSGSSSFQPKEVPLFLGETAGAGRDRVEMEITPPPDVEAALTAESLRQGVSIDTIVTHAVLEYLSDLDRIEEIHELGAKEAGGIGSNSGGASLPRQLTSPPPIRRPARQPRAVAAVHGDDADHLGGSGGSRKR